MKLKVTQRGPELARPSHLLTPKRAAVFDGGALG
jgi:hypothetical protein